MLEKKNVPMKEIHSRKSAARSPVADSQVYTLEASASVPPILAGIGGLMSGAEIYKPVLVSDQYSVASMSKRERYMLFVAFARQRSVKRGRLNSITVIVSHCDTIQG